MTAAVRGVRLFMDILVHLEPGGRGRLSPGPSEVMLRGLLELLVPGPEARGSVPTANLHQTHSA